MRSEKKIAPLILTYLFLPVRSPSVQGLKALRLQPIKESKLFWLFFRSFKFLQTLPTKKNLIFLAHKAIFKRFKLVDKILLRASFLKGGPMSKPKYSLYMRVHFVQELMVLNFNVFRKNWSITQCNFIFSLGYPWSKNLCANFSPFWKKFLIRVWSLFFEANFFFSFSFVQWSLFSRRI